jgi:peptidoglycan endopeptidase LytF
MNAPIQTPSPLVPQGSIPPKNTSRSGRVLLIAATVVVFHIAGLGVVLMQGCQKDAKTAGTSSLETNNLSLPPMDAATNSMFATAVPTNPAPVAHSNVVAYQPPTPIPTPTPDFVQPPTNVAMTAEAGPTTDYKIVSGDNLAKIAKKNKVTLSALSAANPGLDPKKLAVGKSIKIPAPTVSATATPAAPATAAVGGGGVRPVASAAGVMAGSYKVKAGDTLTKIAGAHGVTVSQLRAANNIKTSQIHPGQTLKIPARSTATDTTSTTHH